MTVNVYKQPSQCITPEYISKEDKTRLLGHQKLQMYPQVTLSKLREHGNDGA